MKPIPALLAIAALAACSPRAEQTVENRFDQTQNAIENAAAAIEASTENATDQAANVLENQADALENSIDAIDVVPSNRSAGGK